jgi:hypothetical protein
VNRKAVESTKLTLAGPLPAKKHELDCKWVRGAVASGTMRRAYIKVPESAVRHVEHASCC